MNRTDAHLSRRNFLAAGLAAGLAATPAVASTSNGPDTASSMIAMDPRKLVSRADIVLEGPVPRSEAGLPVGNGRMGTLLWTSPAALRMQINRVDVYANDSNTTSFYIRNTDYCAGCAFADLRLAGFGDDVFPESGFRQHLSVYDGQVDIDGNGVSIRAFAWHRKDVLVLRVADRRPDAAPASIALRMLRYANDNFGRETDALAREHKVAVRTENHVATSQLHVEGSRIALTQEFREGAYCNKSAVAAAIAGRPAKARFANEAEVTLEAAPGAGEYTILLASAASFDAAQDVLADALAQLDAAEAAGYAKLLADNLEWWHEFWSRGFVHLASSGGEAEYVEANYHYFLYLMASSSRGAFPPKFNGMIWSTQGDLRSWGAQHWFANLSCYYEAIPATNRMELLDPVYRMYFNMRQASETAARQQWGSQGLFICETSWFNGLAKLPDEIAEEMQDLYLLRKPWEQRSQRFRDFAACQHPHSGRWNWWGNGKWVAGRWVAEERGAGPFGPVNHNLGTTAKIAYLFWRRYEYTLDDAWLRDRAYPMLHGAVELYRNFPNLKKEADGRYHIHHVNSNESVLGANDTDEDLAAMRGVLPALLRASEILGVDAEMQPVWRELLDHLAPLPTTAEAAALKPASYAGPRVFVRGLKPAVRSAEFALPDGNSLPTWFFDLCNCESNDATTLETANNTFTSILAPDGTKRGVSLLSKVPMAAASLGHGEVWRTLVLNQLRGVTPGSDRPSPNLANRMSLREGVGALDAEALGRAAESLHLALLQSNPPAPAEEPILHVFPAWPGWDAAFTLLARGGFLVTSSITNRQVDFVELEARLGSECRLRNPWGTGELTVYRDGKKEEVLSGTLVKFVAKKGERIIVIPAGAKLEDRKRKILE